MKIFEINNGFFRVANIQSAMIKRDNDVDKMWIINVCFENNSALKFSFDNEADARESYNNLLVTIKNYWP